MSANPWSVENIKEFWFLNCPECAFKTKIEKMFETHAFQNHPMSYAFFGSNKGTSDEVDINDFKIENEDSTVESIEQDDTNFKVNFKKENEDTPTKSKRNKTLEEIMFPDFEEEIPVVDILQKKTYSALQIKPTFWPLMI